MGIVAILELLQAVTMLVPVVASIQPLLEKAIQGGALTDEDITALVAVTAGLNAQAEALETKAIGPTSDPAPAPV